ncbi:MAG: lipase family protein, partial [Candidatus Rokuibacteriota bacterium]
SDDDRDLLTFLRVEAGRAGGAPLEVVVTGHSKGGALAQAVAVWLKDALDSADPRESWDPDRRARVECYAFAGPTAGNTGFARRIERALGPHHHHLRNMNDLVTHAWQVDELRQIPALYGERSAMFERLIGLIAADVDRLGYRHPELGVTPFRGELDTSRNFASEFVYQHLDAYLAKTGLHAHGIRAPIFFF